MELEAIFQLISNNGFAIFVAIYMIINNNKTMQALTDAVHELKNTLEHTRGVSVDE